MGRQFFWALGMGLFLLLALTPLEAVPPAPLSLGGGQSLACVSQAFSQELASEAGNSGAFLEWAVTEHLAAADAVADPADKRLKTRLTVAESGQF